MFDKLLTVLEELIDGPSIMFYSENNEERSSNLSAHSYLDSCRSRISISPSSLYNQDFKCPTSQGLKDKIIMGEEAKNPVHLDLISVFQKWMLEQYTISKRFDEPPPKDKTVRRQRFRGWLMIQGMFIGFGGRALILLVLPLMPENIQAMQWIPLVLGDSIYTLGIPMRQMWFSLCFYYSLVCFALRITMRSLDLKEDLSFVTDYRFLMTEYAESSFKISNKQVESLRKQMKYFQYAYRMFAFGIYSTTFGNLAISLILQVYQTRSIPRFMTGSFWITYQMFWVQNVVPLLCQVLFFLYMSCQVIEMRFAKVIADCHEKLLNRKDNLYRQILTCVEILKDLDHSCLKVAEINNQVKMPLWYIYYIFVPTAATASYVIFTGDFPNWMSFALVLAMSIQQMGLICSYLIFARTIVNYSRGCFVSLFSMQSHLGLIFPVKVQIMIRKRIKHLTNTHKPVAFSCGNDFPITSQVFMDFLFNIMSFVIMMLEAIVNIQLSQNTTAGDDLFSL